jgi:hypothetical protein
MKIGNHLKQSGMSCSPHGIFEKQDVCSIMSLPSRTSHKDYRCSTNYNVGYHGEAQVDP